MKSPMGVAMLNKNHAWFVFSKGFTHFLNSHLCDVEESLLLTKGCTVKYMIKQIEFYTLDISCTIVKKVVDGLPT